MATRKKAVLISALESGSTGRVMVDVANAAMEEQYDVRAFVSSRSGKASESPHIESISSRFGTKITRKLSQVSGLEGCFSIFQR